MIRIPENTTIIGELRSSGEVRIDGRFEGNSQIDGTLILTDTCVWVGRAVADTIVVEGVVEGDVIARKRLLIGSHAKIRGSIRTPSMLINEGAKLRCDIDMQAPQKPAGLLEHKPETAESAKSGKVKDELTEYRNKKSA